MAVCARMTWPASRWGVGVLVATVAVAVGGCGSSGRVAGVQACSKTVARAPLLHRVTTTMVSVAGDPFGVASAPGGAWSFVDETVPSVAVVADGSNGVPRTVQSIALPNEPRELRSAAAALGNSLTHDGRYLLVADGNRGAVVLNVRAAETGEAGAVLGTLEDGGDPALGRGAIEVASSRDEHYAFVSVEYPGAVAVYNLHAALAAHFRVSGYVGSVKLGRAVVGIAVSPNGRWLYVTSELAAGAPLARGLSTPGTLSVISIATAEHDPARSVVRTVDAGCQPVRVVVSANGQTVWVTARASDELLGFSAAKLRSDPRHALIAAVRVGEHRSGWRLSATTAESSSPTRTGSMRPAPTQHSRSSIPRPHSPESQRFSERCPRARSQERWHSSPTRALCSSPTTVRTNSKWLTPPSSRS
jgi:hypothetical protein